MSEVIVNEKLGVPAARAWEVIRNFGGLLDWAEGIETCTVEGDGIGAVRTLGLPGGLKLNERLEAYEEDVRTLSYSIVGASPLPVTGYLWTIRVEDEGGSCTIDWRGTFEPAEGADRAQVEGIIRGVYTSSIQSLRKKLGG